MTEDETSANEGAQAGVGELPRRDVTPNMIVAYNMAYFRKAAGLTQEELGERLGGWTKVAVSAAERSWDGKRVRQFDADLIADIATNLGVPIAAMFLPPEDDGTVHLYSVQTGHVPDGQLFMREFFAYLMSEPPPPDTPALHAYQERFVSAVSKYVDSAVAGELAERLKELATEKQMVAALSDARIGHAALQDFAEAIQGVIEDNELLQDVLLAGLRATAEGRIALDENWPGTQEETPVLHRLWQSELAKIGKEMFGAGGPADRAQLDQVIVEALRRGHQPPARYRWFLPDPGADS